jgi:hypothetical protein
MATSKMLAALIGPTLAALAVSMLLNVGSMPALLEGASRDPIVILLSGTMTFVVGLAIVRIHSLWKGGWFVIVTILGWLFVLGGLVRILLPFQLAAMAAEVSRHTGFIIGEAIIILALGAYLSFKGYSRS